MKRMDHAEVAGRDRHQSRRLLQHGQGGVRGHASAAATGGSSTSARSTARPASTARSIMPPPSRASTASPRRWRRKARATASPSTRSRRAISTPTWSPRCPQEVLAKIVAQDPGQPARQGRGDRPRGRLPGRRECRLRHRLDAVDQRRPAHVLMDGLRTPPKRSVTIAGHETSISLEPMFWHALERAAEREAAGQRADRGDRRRAARRAAAAQPDLGDPPMAVRRRSRSERWRSSTTPSSGAATSSGRPIS